MTFFREAKRFISWFWDVSKVMTCEWFKAILFITFKFLAILLIAAYGFSRAVVAALIETFKFIKTEFKEFYH